MSQPATARPPGSRSEFSKCEDESRTMGDRRESNGGRWRCGDTVVLDVDLPEHGLRRGDVGTVVLVHSGHRGYEVEFVALDGETLAVVSLWASQLRPIGRREI